MHFLVLDRVMEIFWGARQDLSEFIEQESPEQNGRYGGASVQMIGCIDVGWGLYYADTSVTIRCKPLLVVIERRIYD